MSKVGHRLHIRYFSVSLQKVKPVGLVIVVAVVIVVVVVVSVVELVVVGVVVEVVIGGVGMRGAQLITRLFS